MASIVREERLFEEYDDENEEESVGYKEVIVVPEIVRTFVVYLYRHIREQNVYEILQLYEVTFNKLSEDYFLQMPWPPAEAVSQYVEDDQVFLLLYKELYFRHLYAKLQPTLEQRVQSWENYCQLFKVILQGNVTMQLPNNWLWDMVDEFIYQFQSFCQFRSKLRSRSEEEIEALKTGDQWWNVFGVLNYLQALIERSDILQILDDEAAGKGNFTATEGYEEQGGSNVLKVLGYFSIIGLLRVHCLIGDYHTALQRLSAIDISKPGIFHRVIGCQVNTMYYSGFASMMTRRYTDAITAFNVILLQLIRYRDSLEGLPQFDHLLKRNDQMYALLAICLALCPQGKLLEESVNTQVREKFGEKILRMQRGDEAVFDELFSLACPRFVSPAPPNYEEAHLNFNQDAYRLQLKLFLVDVRHQLLVSSIRNFLELYSTISIPRLAKLMEVEESALRSALLTYKHRTHVIDSDGTKTLTADVDFYIEGDTINVVDSKVVRRYGDYFVKHINKFEDVILELENVQLD